MKKIFNLHTLVLSLFVFAFSYFFAYGAPLGGPGFNNPFALPLVTSAPSASLDPQVSGSVVTTGTTIYAYDDVRDKYLTSHFYPIYFSSNGNVDNAYLRIGQLIAPNVGYPFIGDATLFAISSKSGGGNPGKTFEIRIDGLPVPGGDFTQVANEFTSASYDIDVDAGEEVQVFATAAGGAVNDPMVVLWFRSRLDP